METNKSPSTKVLKNILIKLETTNLFEEEDKEDNIKFNELKDDEKRPKIQGGTVPKLVQKLTSHEFSDPQYLIEFIYTYTSFSTPKKFLKLLIARFDMVFPSNLEEKNKEEWNTNILFPVRLRVVNTIKTWATKAFFEFEQDQQLRDRVLDFLKTKVSQVKGLEGAVKQVEKLIERNLKGEETVLAETPPKSHKVKKTIKFIDVHPEEFARQFALMGFKIFSSIRPRECLQKRWQSLEKEKEAPQILAFIDFFNYLSDWVATKIVLEKTPKARAAVVTYIIKLGIECKKINNFCGVMQIVGGLRNSAIKRMKKTWALVSSKTMEDWQALLDLTDSNENFLNMRQQLQLCTPPALPYLGIFLQDLLFIDDGNTDKIANTDLINFNKLRFLATVIQNVTNFQSHPYYFNEVAPLQTFINETPAYDSAALENSSLFLEPREK